MGESLTRRFIAFENLIDPGALWRIKTWTNGLEKETGHLDGSTMKRRINIDPGLLNHLNLVLASTKPAFHRVYIENGIFAEVTLLYAKGSFVPLDWTYSDYRYRGSISYFNDLRRIYLQLRKRLSKCGKGSSAGISE
jgi:hypothetical protein